jgi:hypothetical protein
LLKPLIVVAHVEPAEAQGKDASCAGDADRGISKSSTSVYGVVGRPLVRSDDADRPTNGDIGLQPPTTAAPNPTAAFTSNDPVDPASLANLVKQGEKLLSSGRILAARVVLKRAADAGSAAAALGLGMTYDPIELKKVGARDFVRDKAMARTWYQKAKDLGSNEAAGRLKRLGTRDSRTR